MAMIDESKLDTVLEEIMTRWGIPGLGVGIVQENEIVYARGFGVQSLETRRTRHAWIRSSAWPPSPNASSPRP